MQEAVGGSILLALKMVTRRWTMRRKVVVVAVVVESGIMVVLGALVGDVDVIPLISIWMSLMMMKVRERAQHLQVVGASFHLCGRLKPFFALIYHHCPIHQLWPRHHLHHPPLGKVSHRWQRFIHYHRFRDSELKRFYCPYSLLTDQVLRGERNELKHGKIDKGKKEILR